jgi:hypothetical protein
MKDKFSPEDPVHRKANIGWSIRNVTRNIVKWSALDVM